jgi:mRNA interferase MazF
LPANSGKRVRRGEVFWVDWEPRRGSEQGGHRPALIIQADEANELEHYGNTIVLAMSTTPAVDETVHISVEPSRLNGLSKPGIVRCEQVMTISKSRLGEKLGLLEPRYMAKVDEALRAVLSL